MFEKDYVLTPVKDLVPDKKISVSRFAILTGLVLGLLVALIIRSVVHSYFFYPYIMQNNSMNPAIKAGQKVTIRHSENDFKPKRGEIVLMQHPGHTEDESYFITRIIGLPGDLVSIENRQIFINTKNLQYRWEQEAQKKSIYADKQSLETGNQTRDNYAPIQLSDKMIFVLQDNRSQSIDSRMLGPLPLNLIRGIIELE